MASSLSLALNAFLLAFNFFSAIGTIVLNKYVFDVTHLPPTTLSVVHYVITYGFLCALKRSGVFEASDVPLDRSLVSIAVLTAAGLALSNASLRYNNVWLYQILKILVTPMITLLEYFWYGTCISKDRVIALVVVCLGVLGASASPSRRPGGDDMTLLGIVVGIVLLPVAAVYKVQWSAMQKIYGWDTLTLMHKVLPSATMTLVLAALLTEGPALMMMGSQTTSITPSLSALWGLGVVALSGIGAFFVNWSCFLVVGKISALAHVLLGQFKTCAIVVLAFFFYSAPTDLWSLSSAAVSILAMSYYAYTGLPLEPSHK